MRDSRSARVTPADHLRGASQHGGHLSLALPPLPVSLGNQRLVQWGLEVCALPPLLSPGTDHLERAILSPPALDRVSAACGSHTLSVRRMPVQLRQLPAVQGTLQLAA